MDASKCYHCGLNIVAVDLIIFDDKNFCCNGCKTVFEIFNQNDLTCYYDFEQFPGATPQDIQGKYDFLDNSAILEKLLEFNEDTIHIVSLNLPHIHCSSCIWILENLKKLQPGISASQVNFQEKTVRITYNNEKTNLKEIVYLLSSIGYEPYISLENYEAGQKDTDRSLVYKLGVAFFCFGNIMLLSFPEYFEVSEFWLDRYRNFFRWLIFGLAMPSFFYSASGYYVAAYKGIRAGILNIEIPIALGIIVMFIRSAFDIIMGYGPGFFDSLTGLVFFMLLGKMFQIKTYGFLNFERDYKSYFPVAVTKISKDGLEQSTPIYDILKGDRILIRNQELIPADGILISESAEVDYSFVTGEAVAISKKSGDKVFAGGKQIGKIAEIEVLNSVSQSYLTQLWSNDVFQKDVRQKFKNITDTVSHYFTPILLLIAFVSFGYWIFIDGNTAFNVFTAVLIVACPCALALTAPFTLGNVLRILGNSKFFLKNALVIEQLEKVDTIVFDKTGTITSTKSAQIQYEGNLFDDNKLSVIKEMLRTSNHPLSRMLYDFLPTTTSLKLDAFVEIPGSGMEAQYKNIKVKVGSDVFVGNAVKDDLLQTTVAIQIDGINMGRYIFKNEYRKDISQLFLELGKTYKIKLLSGDNDGERGALEKILPTDTEMVFNQKPEQKLAFIKNLQDQGCNVMMVGDGLNDAGALAQSNVGIAVSENVNVFSPACDAILDADHFGKLLNYLKLSKKAIKVIKMSFILSILYNIVGLSFAVTGHLAPLVAAIIMPLSTVTIVTFVTVMSNYYARKFKI